MLMNLMLVGTLIDNLDLIFQEFFIIEKDLQTSIIFMLYLSCI